MNIDSIYYFVYFENIGVMICLSRGLICELFIVFLVVLLGLEYIVGEYN